MDDKWLRVYHAHPDYSGRQHRSFGPLNRFDQQIRDRRQKPKEQPDGRGVVYLAQTLGTALAEAFQEQGVDVSVCPNMRAVAMAPSAEIELLDITGPGLMKIGAVAGLASGAYSRRLTQRWGRAIYEDLVTLAGIRYRGAHENGICVAAWERTGPLVFEPSEDFALTSKMLWSRVFVALADQGRRPEKVSAANCPTCRNHGVKGAISPR
ncbi:MAG: RES family NAD+ phosphorylase [Solirubrobacteraceae bacterium]